MENKKQFKMGYIIGDMLYKGSTLLRAKEAEELRAIGIPLYSASEQNKDGDINDKTNQTVESNNDLHAHIFKKDIDNIMASDLIIANPERFAEGSICELGAVEMFNHIWKVMNSIIDSDLRDREKVDLLAQWLQNNPYKTTYVHLADIRCTDLPESGYNRSFMMNQFTRGCAVAVQTGVRGVPVSQGGVDVMSWEEIIADLKEVTGFDDEQKQEEAIDGFMILPGLDEEGMEAVRNVMFKASDYNDVKHLKPTIALDDLKDVPFSQWHKTVDRDSFDSIAPNKENKETTCCDDYDGFATVDVDLKDLERTMSLVRELLSSPSISTNTNDIKVGDIIVIKDLDDIKRDSNYVVDLDGVVSVMDYGIYFTDEMIESCGKGLEVVRIKDGSSICNSKLYKVKDLDWTYSDSMIAYIIKGGK